MFAQSLERVHRPWRTQQQLAFAMVTTKQHMRWDRCILVSICTCCVVVCRCHMLHVHACFVVLGSSRSSWCRQFCSYSRHFFHLWSTIDSLDFYLHVARSNSSDHSHKQRWASTFNLTCTTPTSASKLACSGKVSFVLVSKYITLVLLFVYFKTSISSCSASVQLRTAIQLQKLTEAEVEKEQIYCVEQYTYSEMYMH